MAVDSPIATTPEPPYTAVIFSSLRSAATGGVDDGYGQTAARMEELAAEQPGYLGFESARDPAGMGISVSYWVDESAALAWKQEAEHLVAQERGATEWYAEYRVRVATVTREYGAPA
jgi:heme-degrading monooxygenase HmoA